MDVFSNFNSNNLYLSNTSSTTSISVFLPLNVPIMKLKFSLAAPCTSISDVDFYSATTLLNGIVSGALFVPETGGVASEIEVLTADPWCSNNALEFSYPLEIYGYEIASYDWDFGNSLTGNGQNVSANYTAGGDYTVTMDVLTTNGCEYEVTRDVQLLEGPVAGFTSLFNADQNWIEFTNESSISSGSIADYNWDFGDATFSSDFEPTHAYGNTDQYTVVLTVTSDLGCIDSVSQVVSAVGVNEMDYNRIAIDVFPNPTSNEINLHSLESIQFYIVDDLGKRITSDALLPANSDVKLNIENLAVGSYTIVGYNENSLSRTRFVVLR
jgi:PKD repeat protein